MSTKALVWNENAHEQSNFAVAALCPDGLHGVSVAALAAFHGSTESALAAGAFEAASVACLRAGLPTLCEKPLTSATASPAPCTRLAG